MPNVEPRRLFIASNRLPVTVRAEQGGLVLASSSGGLATALGDAHDVRKGEWYGWPGDMSRATPNEQRSVEMRLASLGCVPIHLSPAEVTHYYDGFSNGVLWPLLHYQIDKVRLDASHDWSSYRSVNQRFAERIALRLEPNDTVWIHDYQLALVPSMLRELCPWARVGFFFHVPFPAPEVFNILPWREDVLAGMLGSDLVSFHTDSYRRNFCEAAAQVTNARPIGDALVHQGRKVRTAVHPIGIDVANFEEGARSKEVEEELARLRVEARGRKIVLGVDRLDYTKGIPRRLLAIEQLLTREPALRDKVLFIQLAVPSREKVDAYAKLRRTVNELVGRINSHHGTATGAPLQLLYRDVPRSELIALYRAADVMLVTPLRDGMNLVAKEYVASRVDERGALVLSEFAGAADELTEAPTVNPYDIGAVARAVKIALAMPQEEQRARMASLRSIVRDGDVRAWVDQFLTDLEDDGRTASGARVPFSTRTRVASIDRQRNPPEDAGDEADRCTGS